MRHDQSVMPEEDPLTFSDPAYDAAVEAYYENLAPPAWFYPLVGEVASQAAMLELCMTEAALALIGSTRDPYEMIKNTGHMLVVIDLAVDKKNERFDQLVDPFHRARGARNRIVHALLQWQESDGEYEDYWLQKHPKSGAETRLPTSEPPKSMTDALQNIKDITKAAFELTQALSAR